MNDQARIRLVMHSPERFPRMRGDSEFASTAADMATTQPSTSRSGGCFGADAAVNAEATSDVTLGVIQ
jgi:hypothetical protein